MYQYSFLEIVIIIIFISFSKLEQENSLFVLNYIL